MDELTAPPGGALRRFVFEHAPVRGHWVELHSAWQELKGWHSYPSAIENLLGEAVVASVLLAATLKFQGRLSLQLRGAGPLRLLVAQCTDDYGVRAVAQMATVSQLGAPAPMGAAAVLARGDFASLVGQGQLAVNIEPSQGQGYQGIVQLHDVGLGASLENYFAQSEQLPTKLLLHAADTACRGLLLQQLPQAQATSAAGSAWEEARRNLEQLPADALQSMSLETVIARVAGAYDCRLFAPTSVQFRCNCNTQRVSDMLRALGEAEARSVLIEQGEVTITCEFCGRPYRYGQPELDRLFPAGALKS